MISRESLQMEDTMDNEHTIDSNAIRNPSDGIIARNPTRLEITANADDQNEIMQAVMGITNQPTDTVIHDYSKIDKTDPPPMAGVVKIREMSEKQLKGFFKSLMRSKPNIIKMHLKLGEYTNKTRVVNSRAALLNSNKQRFHTEVAERLADVFADHTVNVTEVIYRVNNKDPNYFSATAEVYSVPSEDYENEDLFSPAIGLEFLVSH